LTIKEKTKALFYLILEPKLLKKLISFRSFGYLLETGWFESFKSCESVDREMTPLPWFTYSAIDFIKERLDKNIDILEFGSGNSTLFFAERVHNIVSIEHNVFYYNKILLKKPNNVEMKNVSDSTSEDYLKQLPHNSKFDIIIIDGLYRNECLINSINYIAEPGVIILDDSERSDYKPGISFLIDKGFKQLSFSGVAPGIFFKKCTSIFYKSKNCLGI
jgi:hypothetical protein